MLSVDALNTTVGDLQRNYLYKILVPAFPAAINAKMDGAQDVANNMDVYSSKFPFPPSKNTPIEVKWGGEKVWFSGPNASEMSVQAEFRLSRDWKPYQFFKTWKDLTGSDETQQALIKPLTLGTIAQLMVDVDKTTVLHRVELRNAVIFEIGELDFDKAGGEEAKFTVTIHYERKVDFYSNLGTV